MNLTRQGLAHASAALELMLPFSEAADGVLSRYFRAQIELGSQLRGFIAETAYGVLRRKRLLEALSQQTSARALILSYLVRIAGMSIRQLEPVLRSDEARWLSEIKARDIGALPWAVQLDLPDWLYMRLQAQMGEAELIALGRSLLQAAPLDLRVNTLLTTREAVLADLQQQEIAAQITPHSPLGIRLAGKPALAKNPLFLSGKIEVQDEGSQLLGFLLAPTRHDTVVDFCAGAGGKTLLLGALMHSQGRLYAFDVSEKRLAQLKPRLKRSGLSNIHPHVITSETDTKVKRLAGKIDKVLVDAPCSGLGTLRRNPDLKWRQSEAAVQELQEKQIRILTAAAKLLKPGGRLVYATCSLLRQENEDVISAFLAAHANFEIEEVGPIFQRLNLALPTGPMLHLDPVRSGTDGFFAAVLKRVS